MTIRGRWRCPSSIRSRTAICRWTADWLSEEQRVGWTYALTHSPAGLLKRIDRGVLIARVVAEDLHRQAATAQSKVGLLVRIKTRATLNQDDPGVPVASRYINIINQQAKILLKAASELGFTPVARPRAYGGPLAPGPDFIAHADQTGRDPAAKPSVSFEDYIAAATKPSFMQLSLTGTALLIAD